jgi:hypothetical protein
MYASMIDPFVQYPFSTAYLRRRRRRRTILVSTHSAAIVAPGITTHLTSVSWLIAAGCPIGA